MSGSGAVGMALRRRPRGCVSASATWPRSGGWCCRAAFYDGVQVAPESWVKAMATPRTTTTEDGLRYGYFWWLTPAAMGGGAGVDGRFLAMAASA